MHLGTIRHVNTEYIIGFTEGADETHFFLKRMVEKNIIPYLLLEVLIFL